MHLKTDSGGKLIHAESLFTKMFADVCNAFSTFLLLPLKMAMLKHIDDSCQTKRNHSYVNKYPFSLTYSYLVEEQNKADFFYHCSHPCFNTIFDIAVIRRQNKLQINLQCCLKVIWCI